MIPARLLTKNNAIVVTIADVVTIIDVIAISAIVAAWLSKKYQQLINAAGQENTRLSI